MRPYGTLHFLLIMQPYTLGVSLLSIMYSIHLVNDNVKLPCRCVRQAYSGHDALIDHFRQVYVTP